MKLHDLVEMTQRTGVPAPSYDVNNLLSLNWSDVGTMQHGYIVRTAVYGNYTYYAAFINNKIITFTQGKFNNLPKIGKVFSTESSITDDKFKGNLLNYKLKYFLVHQLGIPVILGDVHSIATENILKKLEQYFSGLGLLNIKSGELLPWSYDQYLKLTSIGSVTDWRVLLQGNGSTFGEGWSNLPGNTRNLWTYTDTLFNDCIGLDESD